MSGDKTDLVARGPVLRPGIDAIEPYVGGKSKIVHLPLPTDDPKQRRPDIALAQKYLNNWAPTVQLEEGLQRTIAYFRTQV